MYYKETQRMAVWVYIIIFGIIAMFFSFCVPIEAVCRLIADNVKAGWVFYVFIFSLLAPLFCFFQSLDRLRMYTGVDSNHIQVAFGTVFRVPLLEIPLEYIHTLRKVSYRPWCNRLYRSKRSFEGKPCEFCAMRGTWGVLIETNERRLVIGSQHPDKLIAALRDAGVNTDSTLACAD